MLNTATKSEAPGTEQELTDGFHLVIDALKLNGINTIDLRVTAGPFYKRTLSKGKPRLHSSQAAPFG